MSNTVQVPDNIPISWLQQLQEFSPDMLMLASDPALDQTETQYMSKYFTFGMMEDRLYDDLSIGNIWQCIHELDEKKASLSNYLTGIIKLDLNEPYIISSITRACVDSKFGISSIDGYRLSAGMARSFANLDSSGLGLSTVIPQLRIRTHTAANPDTQYISSITDANGYIQSYGYGSFADTVNANIPEAAVTVDGAEYALSSVTTRGGRVVGHGDILLSRAYYRDYSENSSDSAARDSFDQTDLYVMKLTYAQLVKLSASGGIRENCIYLTTTDPEA